MRHTHVSTYLHCFSHSSASNVMRICETFSCFNKCQPTGAWSVFGQFISKFEVFSSLSSLRHVLTEMALMWHVTHARSARFKRTSIQKKPNPDAILRFWLRFCFNESPDATFSVKYFQNLLRLTQFFDRTRYNAHCQLIGHWYVSHERARTATTV